MEVRNCRRCGRIYQYVGGKPLCYDCKEEDEKDFQKVKDYLYEHPNASMSIVSEATGISVSTIRQYLRDERLMISESSPVGIDCESCGVSIKTGRYCKECSAKLATDLNRAFVRPDSQERRLDGTSIQNTKMHYLNRRKDHNR